MINYLVFLEKKEADDLTRRGERLDKVREAVEPLLRRLNELYPTYNLYDAGVLPLTWPEAQDEINKILLAFGEDPHKWRYGK